MTPILFLRGAARLGHSVQVACITALGLLLLQASLVAQTTQTSSSSKRELGIRVGTNNLLVLSRASLGREFLMSASRIPQAIAATSTGLSGRIVQFEAYPDGVDMYEATDGLIVTKDLPARRLMTSFPIVAQDTDSVTIDFNRGMRRLYTEIWIGQGRGVNTYSRDETLEIPQSRVYKAEVQDDRLLIHQTVQVRDRQSRANVELGYEIRYYFSPYTPGTYKYRESTTSDLRYSRFFEGPSRLQETTGRPTLPMARFDLSKPIVFHYSANTPKDYVEAVKDGILYWNRAFGTNVVRAEKAPEGVTAPDPRYNIIQWVPYDTASVAYADLLIDPRTGESLHGQAFITSVFAISGKARARSLLRSMREVAEKKSGLSAGAAELGDASNEALSHPGLCRLGSEGFAQQFAQGIEDVLSNEGLTDETILRIAQDYVRETVAHEVGHVLGLRHNFAGSIAATMSRQELEQWFLDYAANKKLDAYTNRWASSSTMEYSVFRSAVQLGWFIRTHNQPLPHDRAAIRWGYFGETEPRDKKYLFGTDDHVGLYGDLNRFDQGTTPVVGAYTQLGDELRLLPNSVIESFIAAKAPRNPADAIPIAEVNLSPGRYAGAVAGQFGNMLTWFRSGTRSIRVENGFDFIGELNEQERFKAHWKDLNQQLDQIGGVDRALFSFLPLDLKLELKDSPKNFSPVEKVSAAALSAKLRKLLEAPSYTNFVGLDEKKYSFTPEEKEIIQKRGDKLFADFEAEVIKQACQRLETAERSLAFAANDAIEDNDANAKLEQRIIEMARLILTSKDDSKRIRGKVDKSLVEIVDFKYDHETRLAAAKMLNDKTGAFRGWSIDAKSDLNKQLKDDIDGSLNIPNFKEFKESMLSRPLREWYLRQQDILQILPPKPPGK